MRILNFGSLNIDHVYRVHELVRPGETIDSQDYQRFAGGKGLNQSIALAYAGADVCHAGCIGEDGDWLKQTLHDAGADISHVRTAPGATGHAIIQVNEAGENAIVLHGGTNRAIAPVQATETLTAFNPGDMLLLQNEINAIPEIISRAAEQGLRIVFNAAPMSPAIRGYPLEHIGCFIINKTEGEALTGEQDPDTIVELMRTQFPAAAVVLTLGADGARYADANGQARCAAETVEPVDTTAAGDTFTGYFLAELAQGHNPELAMRVATRAAAICVTRPGAGASIPRRDEIDT